MKTFREYLSISQFEDIWSEIVENYLEPEEIKSVYAKYYEKLKALPHKSVRGIIDMPEPISRWSERCSRLDY